jgi:hypothetical protein
MAQRTRGFIRDTPLPKPGRGVTVKTPRSAINPFWLTMHPKQATETYTVLVDLPWPPSLQGIDNAAESERYVEQLMAKIEEEDVPAMNLANPSDQIFAFGELGAGSGGNDSFASSTTWGPSKVSHSLTQMGFYSPHEGRAVFR